MNKFDDLVAELTAYLDEGLKLLFTADLAACYGVPADAELVCLRLGFEQTHWYADWEWRDGDGTIHCGEVTAIDPEPDADEGRLAPAALLDRLAHPRQTRRDDLLQLCGSGLFDWEALEERYDVDLGDDQREMQNMMIHGATALALTRIARDTLPGLPTAMCADFALVLMDDYESGQQMDVPLYAPYDFVVADVLPHLEGLSEDPATRAFLKQVFLHSAAYRESLGGKTKVTATPLLQLASQHMG
ncbi:hypothetical protein [Acanthopleuribacter pedis]|uniref:Uncharacterized protein n=1 Tax=Acanthopleuribacter pedis TaxID=442870 RepID=A0A8J7U6F0_9BACT|nr:hypothetical protein [Acanthopleuribacter pedis]MBO1321388.1 hypothetical protein [Acanthopleuribacter pedis]